MNKVIEAIGDLGHEDEPKSPLAKLGQEQPEAPIAKLGQEQPEPEELEPEEVEPGQEFDAREYVTSRLDLGEFLEPLGFTKRDRMRPGVTAYVRRHVPLARPTSFLDENEKENSVTWANIHVRFDDGAAIPFWRVSVALGHDKFYYSDLQMAKIVRVPEGGTEWVPDAVEAAQQAIEVISQPRHLAFLLYFLKQAGFKRFNRVV